MKFGIALAVVALSGSLMVNAFAQTGGTTKQQKSPAVSQQAKETWVCPMHADVSSDKAGTCTKCGMALEKRVAANDVKHAKRHADEKAREGKTKEECKKNCEGKSKEECMKNCEGKGKEGCKGECCKGGEAGCAGKH